MTDNNRVVWQTEKGYKKWLNNSNGHGLHWTSDIHDELPIRMSKTGNASRQPITMCEVHQKAVNRGGDSAAMHVERNG